MNPMKATPVARRCRRLAAAFSGLAVFSLAAHGANPKPNVVLFYADDMGYGEIQRFHPERSKVPTPHLNQLCDEGMMFTDAHTSSSVCTPSRYALLTGRYNWRTRHQSGVAQGGKPCLIAADRMTLASLFKAQGYQTAMFGKWHLDFQYQVPKGARTPEYRADVWNYGMPVGTVIPDGPVSRGFDYFLGFHHSRTMSSLIENDTVVEYIKCVDVMQRLADAVIGTIDEHARTGRETPFFIYYPMNSPHQPVVPRDEWKGRSGINNPYTDFVAQTDDAVGQVLKALEKNGLKENTIVLFATDNGCHKPADTFLKDGHAVSGPLRDRKTSIHDGGHRVPFIVRWPGVVEAGSRSDQLVCMTDLFATFAEFFAFEYADDTAEDSIGFLSILKGVAPEVARGTIVHHDFKGRFAVREGDWKLILRPDDKVKGATGLEAKFQLYHMKHDIAEADNLANETPEKVDTLVKLLEKQVADGRSTPGAAQQNDTKVDIWKKKKRAASKKLKPHE
ncbi:MAG: sulfatase family protein [Verrucomicrobiales bacterium]|nr:arylsulfatase [Verrucomicrobiota bacterium JB025]